MKQSYVVMLMFQTIFWFLALFLMFYVFYRVIEAYLSRIANGGKTFLPVSILHWVFLGVLGILMVVNAAMYIALLVMDVNGSSQRQLIGPYNKIVEARIIISWLMSLEILVWTIFIIAKSRFSSKVWASPCYATRACPLIAFEQTGSITLALAGFFLFVFSLEQMIVTIMYTIEANRPPVYLDLVTSVISFFCTIGIYFGLIFCCIQWCKASKIYSQEHAQQAQHAQPPPPPPGPYAPMSSYQLYQPQAPSHPAHSGYSSPVSGGLSPVNGYSNPVNDNGRFSPAELHSESDAASHGLPSNQPHHPHA